MGVERRDEPDRQVVLRCAHRQPGRVRRHDLVADVLVDEIRCLPQAGDVDARVESHPGERGRERLAGDTMERERERIDRAGDQVGAGARGLERVGEAAAARSLAVEADGQARGLLDPSDELGGLVWLEPAARIVHERTGCLDVGQLLRLLDELVHRARVAGAVHEPGVELLARVDDRLTGVAEVRDVVERVVQAEDVDAVLGGRGDEPAHEVRSHRARADEEAAAQRQPERRASSGPSEPGFAPTGSRRPRLTAVSKTPPPEISRQAKPALSSTSAIPSSSPVGTLPASGSCESRRIVVSMRRGTSGSLPSQPFRPGRPCPLDASE